MGAVFEGYDSTRNCRVAIKLLKSTDSDAVRRMQREAAVLSRVRHPNVCAIHEFGETEGQPWIMMPLLRNAQPGPPGVCSPVKRYSTRSR